MYVATGETCCLVYVKFLLMSFTRVIRHIVWNSKGFAKPTPCPVVHPTTYVCDLVSVNCVAFLHGTQSAYERGSLCKFARHLFLGVMVCGAEILTNRAKWLCLFGTLRGLRGLH